MPECPEPSALARFIEGGLDDATRDTVATHVDKCELCLEVVAASSPLSELSTRSSGRAPLEPGDRLGRYVLLERVGAGGLGEVFAAYDPQLDRRVAIKVNRTQLFEREGDPQPEERALKEAQALAALSHPNIVPVHDAGVHASRLFIAMEFIEGETLEAWRRRVKPGWAEIRDAYVAAGRGLAAAHAQGFVHRDFKPSNVMLGPGSRVRVVDFGLALHPTVPQGPSVDGDTSARVVLGTPAYMAPEQLMGADLDARVDVFAWSLSFIEALVGTRPPRHGDGTVDLDALANPSSVPGWLLRALRNGVAAKPSARFRDIEVAIEAVTADQRRGRSRRWLAAAAVLSLAAVGTVVAVREPPPSASALDRVTELSQAARDAAAKAYFVLPPPNSDERTALQFVVELEVLEGSGDEGYEEAQRLRAGFAETLVRLGDKYWDADGGRPFSIDYYASALVFVPEHERAAERAAMTRGEVGLLREHARTGTFTEAERSAARVLIALAQPDQSTVDEQLVKLVADEDVAASTRERLRKLRGQRGDKAVKALVADNGLDQRAPEDEPPKLKPDVGSTATPEGNPSAIDEAPGRRPDSKGKSAAKLVTAAKREWKAGKFAAAESLYHQALDARAQHVGALRGLAQLHREQGKYAKALRFARAAVKAKPKDGGLHLLLGEIYFRSSRYADARSAFAKAKDLGHPDAADRLERVERRTSASK